MVPVVVIKLTLRLFAAVGKRTSPMLDDVVLV